MTYQPELYPAVIFKSNRFLRILQGLLITLLLLNILSIVTSGSILPVIPITFLSIMLLLIHFKHPKVVITIRIWSAILLIGGLAQVVSFFLRLIDYFFLSSDASIGFVTFESIVLMLFLLGVGAYYFFFTSKYVEVTKQ